MKKTCTLLVATLGFVPLASADIAPDPCFGLSAGDSCTTPAGESGVCADEGGVMLACNPSPSGDGGSTTTATPPATSDSGGESDEDGGCSWVTAPRSSGPDLGWAFIALGAALAIRRPRG